MSQREVLIVLAHALNCHVCRGKMMESPEAIFRGRNLSEVEKESLAKLTEGDFYTTQLLARGSGVSVDDLRTYQDHPVARLRHF